MAYFDNAATTYPKPEIVYQSMDQFQRHTGGSFGRGNYGFSSSAKSIVDDTRAALQQLLHCPAKQVIFEPSATISLNIIIQGIIEKGARNIYISPFEHNAVTRTLHHYETKGLVKVVELTVNKDLCYDIQRIRFQFENTKPDLVIVSHASNVIGLVAPVEEIFTLAKEFHSLTLLDMAQTAGLVDCDIGKDIFDFAVFAGHKTLLGPTGISGFVMKPTIDLEPVFFGGTGFDSANQDMPGSLPERFEFGTMNTIGVVGLNASVKWILQQEINNLAAAELKNRARLIEILNEYDFISVVGNCDGRDYVGIVSCVLNDISSDTAGQLFSERNISVRTGLQCAPAAHRFLNTFPAGTVRFSVNCFTTDEDFDVLREALDDINDNL
ncbi:cysteine desulfurase [Subdoligranulum sp. APC924/74]|uniref:aminotransferase class V-fold PLP-dependent enzyme n=1 Tax=Subdoligranulum sp. APC924/74 TaxID=2086273 RepID=UPI000DE81411|nr:aminotransferase class V-fold PLP-dependent enzyme [Subdoligranulum sp. APC924/74]RCH53383.1 cysteine desulfurase [Subdoligranulum sp. APC924/74]